MLLHEINNMHLRNLALLTQGSLDDKGCYFQAEVYQPVIINIPTKMNRSLGQEKKKDLYYVIIRSIE